MKGALLALAASCLMSSAMSQERAITKEVVVRAPVAAAFKAWATSEGIQSFFAPEAIVEPRPGGLFSIHFNPYARAGMKGADGMRVLAVQPDRMISFTWNAPPHLPEARAQHTVVIVRTEAQGEDRTRVRLTHLGWGEGGQWDEAFKYFDGAWSRVLANLEKRFAEKPMDWTEWLARMKAYEDGQRK
ncbi:MAG TPA: SRPBCC domain-containing protein [Usitatibacter sp.]|nr:SRPBCC domain-containing protein [Usitatibacter sp.]